VFLYSGMPNELRVSHYYGCTSGLCVGDLQYMVLLFDLRQVRLRMLHIRYYCGTLFLGFQCTIIFVKE
jgi:hypothetical protein